jgi:choline dehydrogenase-like flavoprotein
MTELVRGERPGLTFSEQALRGFAVFIAVVSVASAGVYLDRWIAVSTEYPFVVNSAAKEALLLALCGLVFWDVRRWSSIAVPLLVLAHVVMSIVLLVAILWAKPKTIGHTVASSGPLSESMLRWGWFGADVGVAATFLVLHYKAARSRYDLRFLPPCAFRALMALAEVLVLRDDREISAAEVGVNVDQYLATFRARAKWKILAAFVVLAYAPLVTLHPPFHVMSANLRERWIKDRFLNRTRDWLVPRFVRDLRSALIRTAQQFCFFGYYADARAAEKVGYLPFSRREGYDKLMREVDPNRRRVRCMKPGDIHGEDLSVPTVIVGTGAAGATLAYELAQRGREVLLLERGLHVDPSTFTENEATQLSNLYADGALTLSLDFRFRVAQGMCVGGSTVVNNAVCFDLPDPVRDRWLGRELEAGLDAARLTQAFADVRDFLHVRRVGPASRLNPGAGHLVAAIRRLGDKAPGGRVDVVECNIDGCLGSGYCNIGCAFGKKLSALDWTLPHAQRDFPGKVSVLPECQVEKVLMSRGRATGVRARLSDGRHLTVHADTVVLSAGAIASSLILQASRLGEGRAGRGLSFNLASPVTLDFPEKLHSERGLQISHYFMPRTPPEDEGFTIETWFNPVVSQALFMPGWFAEHRANMLRYQHMTCLGVVVGTESNGTVRRGLLGGVDLKYEPTDEDFVKLKKGVRLACKIGLAAGALRALPSTFEMVEITNAKQLSLIDTEIGDDSDISVNSAHPQGGNAMSVNAKKGVVDPSFRVYGTDNVYVCDASVFPSSITVNPQLTVMALAVYAAEEIAGTRPTPQAPRSIVQPVASGPGS